MDNSVFFFFLKMLMGGFNTNAQNFSQENSQNNQNTQNSQNNASSYYPDEMFVAGENQNNTQNNVNAQSFAFF